MSATVRVPHLTVLTGGLVWLDDVCARVASFSDAEVLETHARLVTLLNDPATPDTVFAAGSKAMVATECQLGRPKTGGAA
jgi:hypothetical protein